MIKYLPAPYHHKLGHQIRTALLQRHKRSSSIFLTRKQNSSISEEKGTLMYARETTTNPRIDSGMDRPSQQKTNMETNKKQTGSNLIVIRLKVLRMLLN